MGTPRDGILTSLRRRSGGCHPIRSKRKHPMAHPRMYDDSNPAIRRLREICLALPGVLEKEAWGECTFPLPGGSMVGTDGNHPPQPGPGPVWVQGAALAQEYR